MEISLRAVHERGRMCTKTAQDCAGCVFFERDARFLVTFFATILERSGAFWRHALNKALANTQKRNKNPFYIGLFYVVCHDIDTRR